MQNYKAKTVKLIGFSGREEDVVPARERILELKLSGAAYGIDTNIHEVSGILYFKCLLTIYVGTQTFFYTGSSSVKPGEAGGFEAAETRAIGRAIAAYGIGIETNYSTAEELSPTSSDPTATNTVQASMSALADIQGRRDNAVGKILPADQVQPIQSSSASEEAESALTEAPKRKPRSVKAETPKAEPAQQFEQAASLPLPSEQPAIEVKEVPALIEPEPAPEPAPDLGEGKNRFGIDIPELTNGIRSFTTYIPVIMKLEEVESNMMPRVSEAIVKLGLKDFISTDANTENWELLLRNGSVPVINTVLNTLL